VKAVWLSGTDMYGEEWAVSNSPLGWLKVRCIAEVTRTPEEDKHLSLLSICSYRLAISYFLGTEWRGLNLSEFPWWIRGSWFVTHCFGFLYEKSSLVWLTSRWWGLVVGFPRSVTLTTRKFLEGKIGLVLGNLKFQFRSCISAIGPRPSLGFLFSRWADMGMEYGKKLAASSILGLCSF